MELSIHRTELVSDTVFVDLQTLDGKLQTVVFKKESEPNNFKEMKTLDGDEVDRVVAELKGKIEARRVKTTKNIAPIA